MLLSRPLRPVLAPAAALSARAVRPRTRRPRCLVAPLHPERGLALALARHLAAELPWMEFTLADGPDIAVVWVCGYERGNAALIRRWRESHPDALLFVTAKLPADTWAGEVLAAGADHAHAWPLDLERLARLLGTAPLARRA